MHARLFLLGFLFSSSTQAATEERLDAGTDGEGRSLTVVHTSFPVQPEDGCTSSDAYVLEVRTQPKAEPQTISLLHLCNDGYGAAGVGMDDVSVGPNTLTHTQSGGSNHRWSATSVYRLSPLRLLRQSSSGTIATDPDNKSQDVKDWRTGGALEERCDPTSCQRSAPVPSIPDLPREGAETEWKTVRLGECATRLHNGGAAEHGFVLFGQPAKAPDVWMALVAVGDPSTLIVEVKKKAWIIGGHSWVSDDHLEVWMGLRRVSGPDEPKPTPPIQWGIRLADGKLFSGFGSPANGPTVERVELPAESRGLRTVRFKIRLPNEVKDVKGNILFTASPPGFDHGDAFAVSLSEGDGRRQVRLFSSAQVERKQGDSLGRLYHLSCELKGGELVRLPRTPDDE
jgi:hypothetical protein